MESTLKTYGRFRAYTGVFISFIVGFCMILFGTYIIQNKPKFTKSQIVRASNVVCYSNTCTANVMSQSVQFHKIIKENENVKVYYTNDTPPKVSSETDDIPKQYGVGLIICACCIFIISVVVAITVSKSNNAATIYGGVSAISNIKGILNKD